MKKSNIYNKVKTAAVITAIAVGSAGMTSCGEWLELEPHNEITQENFWNQAADVQSAVSGCYLTMESNAVLSRMLVWGEFRADNVTYNGTTTAEKDASLDHILKEGITATNAYTYWGDIYTVINRCNTVINFAPQVAAKDLSYSPGEMKMHIAEVTTLRSLMYFYLIRTFRNVPYVEEAYLDDSKPQKIGQTDFYVVLDKLIASLEAVKNDAYTEFPESTNDNEKLYSTSRVTKPFIWALLSEMYLWKQDYDNCIKYADMIIDFKKKKAEEQRFTSTDFEYVNGYPLINFNIQTNRNRNHAFDFNQIFVTGNSMESIFELNFNGASFGQYNEPISNFYGAEGHVARVIPAKNLSDLSDKKETKNVFAEKNNFYDGRLFKSIRYNYGGNPMYIYKYTASGDGITFRSSQTPYTTGYYADRYGVYGDKEDSRNSSNFIIYRLSDIMLLKAEALALKISSDAALSEGSADYDLMKRAFDLVQAVNNRALLEDKPSSKLDIVDIVNKKDMIDLVYDERNRELLFEGKRYFDLVRRTMREGNSLYLADKCSKKDSNLGAYIKSFLENYDPTQPNAIFWPINLDEIKADETLKQNGSFNSGESTSMKNSAN